MCIDVSLFTCSWLLMTRIKENILWSLKEDISSKNMGGHVKLNEYITCDKWTELEER